MNGRALLLAATLLPLVGCGDTTASGRATFTVRLGGVAEASRPFTFVTDQGWEVTLADARIAVGPIYLNTIAPVVARRGTAERLHDLFVPSAWAHGALHQGAGRVVGQVTTQHVVDLLDPVLNPLPEAGDGVLEAVQSVEFWYYPAPSLQGAAVRVAGAATREGVTVRFAGALLVDASLATPQRPLEIARRVRGVPARFALTDGGVLTVRIDPRGWFRGADFSELLTRPASPEGVRAFDRSDNVGRAFVENARATQGMFLPEFHATP